MRKSIEYYLSKGFDRKMAEYYAAGSFNFHSPFLSFFLSASDRLRGERGDLMNPDKSNIVRFKNDNRANSSLVIDHILTEVESHIEKLTGKKVKLTATEMKH